MVVLFIILTIDAFRTLFESFYFGAWYTARVGLLPISIHDFLVQPQMVIIPKLLNVFSAGLVIIILFRYWLPREGEEIKHLETTVHRRTRELSETIEKLETEIINRILTGEALKESEAKFMDLYENAPDMYASVNAKTAVIEACNLTLANTLGYSKEDINGRPVFDIYHPDCLEEVKETFKLFVKTGAVHNKELQLQRKDGSKLNVSLNASAVRGENGQILFSRSTLRDITEQKRMEVEITKYREHLEELVRERTAELEIARNKAQQYLDIAGVILVVIDTDRRVTLINQKGCEVLESTPREIIGKDWFETFVPANIRQDVIQAFHRLMAGEIEPDKYFENPVLTQGGEERLVAWNNALLRDSEGNITGTLSSGEDITEQRRAEKQIINLNQDLQKRAAALQAANKELEAFAYSVSHDLRAPLRHIDGFMELLQKKAGKALDDQARHYMDVISDAAKKMGLLIDELLSFSRMGRHAMAFKQVDLGTLVRDVIRELEPDIAGRNIEWRISDLPAVGGDASMLRIVLVNLVSNALKFTRARQQAQIEIGSTPNQGSEAVIFVRDNGVGFDMTYVDKLFGVFQRLHRADEFEGTGIGLANVRRIIARHGGRTWVEGKVDQGATFYFSLPQAT